MFCFSSLFSSLIQAIRHEIEPSLVLAANAFRMGSVGIGPRLVVRETRQPRCVWSRGLVVRLPSTSETRFLSASAGLA